MQKLCITILWGWIVLFAQAGTDYNAVRAIRLENLKQNYTGKSIRFVSENSRSIQGTLLDVTPENLIIAEHGSPVPYKHRSIDYIFVNPGYSDLGMVFGITALGGSAGYLAVILAHPNPDANMKGVIASLGASLAGIAGYRAFYKPIRIDISGKAFD